MELLICVKYTKTASGVVTEDAYSLTADGLTVQLSEEQALQVLNQLGVTIPEAGQTIQETSASIPQETSERQEALSGEYDMESLKQVLQAVGSSPDDIIEGGIPGTDVYE